MSQTAFDFAFLGLNQPQLHSFYDNNFDRRWHYTEINYALVAVVFYLFTIYLSQPTIEEDRNLKAKKLQEKQKQKELKKQNPEGYVEPIKKLGLLECFMIGHNLILCIFSFLTFINTAPIIFSLWKQHGYLTAFAKYFPEVCLFVLVLFFVAIVVYI